MNALHRRCERPKKEEESACGCWPRQAAGRKKKMILQHIDDASVVDEKLAKTIKQLQDWKSL
ncbi:hypothetical protein I656_03532 [Geobacillus sp. WSUCF1]|nr:hypothetical protein I656_03532 [Geobacillus sp. WSUCF1]